MGSVSIADAKAHLSELVERASGGEAVQITRRGKPIAQIVAAKMPRKRIDIAVLREMVERMPMQVETAGDFMRRIRDEARY
ncbi:MAG: type II toxin-antitoxin system prevent-host-death family antitoxin [Acidiphilium sp.]|nr:type II toxin-antitoxin system prevent-host-death family antitoxin [Acidiphilium sp.]MDD4937283.1 type II toxin-antitoxin system prevent-host-death family antitoxin [Acidiphilium sp.]